MKPLCLNKAFVLAALLFCVPALADDDRWIVHFEPGKSSDGRAAIQASGARVERDLAPAGVNAVAVTIPEAALSGLRSNPNIAFVEEDVRRYPMAESVPYGITKVQADVVAPGTGNRKVCIIDSGYYPGHEDLQDNVTGGGANDPFIDSCGHGTHVAGTIAALNQGEGIIGVMPEGNLGLHIVKVFGDSDWNSGSCGWSYSSSLVDAAYDCANNGAQVINMSLGGGTASSTEEQAFQDLLDANILSIAAAGNDGNTTMSYPASYPAVVSVAAIDSTKTVASFSQQNSQVELAAPGVDVISTVPSISATVVVDNVGYVVSQIDRSASASASGGLVSGGLCDGVGNWSGQVVLCERGSISFSQKVSNVESGGGVAAIIYNNASGGFLGTLDCNGPSWATCSTIPAVSMSQADGQYLVTNKLGATASVSTESTAPADGYESYNGTSMATPHVAGVAALIWSHDTTKTAADIRNALAATAEDLGDAGRDNAYGYGLINAEAALTHLGGGGGGGTNTAPVASFTYTCVDLACDFDGSGSSDADGDALTYSWQFGTDGTGSGVTASHTFSTDGSYTVTLTVSDGTDTGTDSQTVTVSSGTANSAPTASFTHSCTDLSCSFDGSASSDPDGDALSYSWDFGDGSTATGATASHTYAADGTYTVTLTVSDGALSDSSSQSVTVSAPVGGVSLSATGYKVKGRWTTDLSWSGTTVTSVDVYRDGNKIATTANDGAYTDSTNFRGGGSLTYQVCEAGTSTCSSQVTVIF